MKKIIHFIPLVLAMFFACQNPTAPPAPVDPSNYWVCSTDCKLSDTLSSKDRAMALKGRQWPQNQVITVQLQTPTAEQKQVFEQVAKDIESLTNLTFTYPPSGPYKIRVSFVPGRSWAYIGTDNNGVPQTTPSMQIGFRDGNSYYPVILHELGHSVSLLHEHQNPNEPFIFDEPVVIARLSGPPNYWNLATIRFNVLDLWARENVIATNRDDKSIMMYNLPAEFFVNKIGVTGGKVLSPQDKLFLGTLYPKSVPPPPPPVTSWTVTTTQANTIKRLTLKVKVANDAAKVANDSLINYTNFIFK